MVYEESVSKWVRNLFAGTYDTKSEYTDVEAFVARLYEYVLGRTPDAEGSGMHGYPSLRAVQTVVRKLPRASSSAVSTSRKNTSNDAFVEMLYAYAAEP